MRMTDPVLKKTTLQHEVQSLSLFRELEQLRNDRSRLLHEWGEQIKTAKLLAAADRNAVLEQTASAYDDYMAALLTSSTETLPSYLAHQLPGRLLASGIEASEVFRTIILLQDLLANEKHAHLRFG